MALQELPGKTLGQKRKHYNELVKKVLDDDYKVQAEDFNPADNDVHNLMKIDVAGNKRNVDYLLNILQCNDMLYVSRAIKQSKWLFAESQYSHIINPRYLHTELFPNMTTKACAKLLFHIRIYLKDADRVEDFYNFIMEKDINTALSWLPHCSQSFVEIEVAKHHEIFMKNNNLRLLKRLCEKSITILEILIKTNPYEWYDDIKKTQLEKTMFLINSQTTKFMDIVESVPRPYGIPYFGPKATSILMRNCPQLVLDKMETYCTYDKIHLETLAKHLKPEEIKNFITKICENKNSQVLISYWIEYDKLKHFVRYLPTEGRFGFIKKYLIEKCSEGIPSPDIYKWYSFAPFKIAFANLTKLIRTESEHHERVAMFGVLLSCANHNLQNIQTILLYYNDKHINEPFKFKIKFVNMLFTKTDTYRFNETAWNSLNSLFYNMEVYVESENNVQTCIEAIILYKLLHNEKIPVIIENKFEFQSMESIKKKLTDEERNKVFNFLYKTLECKIKNYNISSEMELTETIHLLENLQTLLTNWNKNLIDYPWYLDKVKELIKLKSDNSWKANISTLFTKNKSWRRIMFKESLMLSPSEETCYNALKHDPKLMTLNMNTDEDLRRDVNVSLQRVLRALRVYWPQTLAADWMAWYISNLDKPGVNKSVIRGLCTLATQQQLIVILKKYAPAENKINNEDDEFVPNLRKYLARNMYVSRPLLSLKLVLLYAKGDYLHFALPSLNAVLHNMSAAHTRELLPKLLDAPVLLQKHGIRLAFTKLESEELKILFHDLWKKSKIPSIRAVLFEQTYKLLCRQTNPTMMQEIWELLSIFIDNLSSEENKKIYNTLTYLQVDKVPMLVRCNFLMKSFNFLKSLPPQANYSSDVDELIMYKMEDLIDHLDSKFVANVLLETVDKQFFTAAYPYRKIKLMASYLLCATDADSQSERYNKVLLPMLERSFVLWDVKLNDDYWARVNVIELLQMISAYLISFVFEKNMVFPTKLFADIQDQLEKRLPVEQNYLTQTTWKLIATYVKLLEEHKDMVAITTKHEQLSLKTLPKFSQMCLEYLREDIQKLFPSVYKLFAKCLFNAFRWILGQDSAGAILHEEVYLELLQSLLKDEEFVPSYLVVLKNIPPQSYTRDYEFIEKNESIQKKIVILREKIFSNPSVEVKWHYFNKYTHHDIESAIAQ